MDRSIRKNFVIPLLFLTSFSGYSKDEELFLHANKCYEKQECDKALELYQSMNCKGPAAWYNMGNCCYQLDNYVDAMVCWKRAQRGASYHDCLDIEHNEQEVNML